MKLIAITIFIFLFFTELTFSQETPCPKTFNQQSIFFQKKLEEGFYEQIIFDFSSVDFTELSKESEAEIRFCFFLAQLSLRDYDSLDSNNFRILIQTIDKIEHIECKQQYLIILSNLLVDRGHYFPKISINLIEIILNYFEFPTQNKFHQIKYNLLTNQYYFYSDLQLFKEAEKIKLKRDEIKLPNQKVLENLFTEAYYFLSMSNYNEAYSKLKKADKLIMLDGCLVKDSIDFYIVWAKFFKKINRIDDSKLYYKIALQISIDNGFTYEIDRIQFELILLEDDNEKKIEYLEKKINNFSEIQDDKLLIGILDALANSYYSNNQYEKALKIWQTLYKIEKEYKENVNQITLFNLAIGLKKYEEFEKCYSIINEAVANEFITVVNNFSYFSNLERSNYWFSKKWLIDFVYHLSSKASIEVPLSSALGYNVSIFSKSLLLETSRELDQAVSQSSDEDMKTQFSEMKQFRKLYSKQQSEGSSNKEVMERYKTQADSLDKILVNKLGEYAASKRKFEFTWKDVQSNIKTTDAAIEFARYYDDKDSLYKYMALVVRPDYEYPKLVNLGEEEAIRTAAQNKDFSTLYNEAWKGIDSLLVGVTRIYYSPAGELNNVSFAALCTEEGNELFVSNKEKKRELVIGNNKTSTKACNAVLMDKYELHQLTTTRYLADGTLKKEKPMQPSIALVGGINFNDFPDQTKEVHKQQSNEDFAFHSNLYKRTASTNGKKRGKRNSSNYDKKMVTLLGTKEEVVNIAGLLTTSNWKVQTKSDKKAGEYELKKELETKVPGVLHIATHGFAFPDEAKKESDLMDMNQMSTYKVSEDPMVRCGLMLSGSNISWTGNPQKMIEQTGDDGILTAAEVANFDLSNTKLVVLSACETGLGKIEGTEGTFGLKRGFKLAGVEQMIVSLWSVPDNETMELMTLFYSDLTKTLNPVNSFEKAQKEMRNKYPTDPEKWAGFVLVR